MGGRDQSGLSANLSHSLLTETPLLSITRHICPTVLTTAVSVLGRTEQSLTDVPGWFLADSASSDLHQLQLIKTTTTLTAGSDLHCSLPHPQTLSPSTSYPLPFTLYQPPPCYHKHEQLSFFFSTLILLHLCSRFPFPRTPLLPPAFHLRARPLCAEQSEAPAATVV